ncbi:MAG: formate dehydrogenase accessory sulfurtransferase FdhD [Nitrospinota bacterium]
MAYVYKYTGGRFGPEEIPIVEERPLSVVVNGQELATLMATPAKLDYLVLGFLYFERIITAIDDVQSLEVDVEDATADVELRTPLRRPARRVITTGCTGGVSFHLSLSEYPLVNTDAQLQPENVFPLIRALYASAHLYRRSRGIHAAALGDGDRLLITAEDVGRHNALDKIQGEALARGIRTEGRLLLSTGRISSEMLRKGARMMTPFIISRTSPTSLAVESAKRLGVTLIGYARNQTFNVYSHPQRIDYRRPGAKARAVQVVEAALKTSSG